MIVLHAGVFENSFYLWGETPPEPESPPGRGRPGQKRLKTPGRSPDLYPYDAGAAGLGSALQEAVRFKVSKKSAELLILRLPAVGTRPVPSSPLIAGPPDPKGEAALLPWRVSARINWQPDWMLASTKALVARPRGRLAVLRGCPTRIFLKVRYIDANHTP